MNYTIYNSPLGGTVIVVTTQTETISIPADPQNTDYQVYLAWVAAGNTASVYSDN